MRNNIEFLGIIIEDPYEDYFMGEPFLGVGRDENGIVWGPVTHIKDSMYDFYYDSMPKDLHDFEAMYNLRVTPMSWHDARVLKYKFLKAKCAGCEDDIVTWKASNEVFGDITFQYDFSKLVDFENYG